MIIRVVIADDHPIVRDGLASVLERTAPDIRVLGLASDGHEALRLIENKKPDVSIVDIGMPGLNGIEVTRRLCEANPGEKVIILSMHDTSSFVAKALLCGARGYVVKETATAEILQAIREVNSGRHFLSPAISGHIVAQFLGASSAPSPVSLTPREREILQLIAEGMTNKDVACALDLSVNTVHVHRTNMMRKLGIHSQADLIRYALKEGIAAL